MKLGTSFGSPETSQRLANLPGPKGKFLVGNWPEMRRGVLEFFVRCAREYGDVTGYSAFHIPFCLVNHPSLIKQILVDDAERVVKSKQTRELRIAFGNGLVTDDGQSWHRQRPIVQPLFKGSRNKRYSEIIIDRTERMLEQWVDNSERDLHDDLTRLVFEITGEAFLAMDMSSQWDEARLAVNEFLDAFEAAYTRRFPTPMAFPLPGNLSVLRRSRRRNRDALDLVREHKRRGVEGDDLISLLLGHRDQNGQRLSDRQVRDHVRTMMMTGFETTAVALTWTVYFLAGHPPIESGLLDEWDRALGGRRITLEDIPELSLTNQVILESMRLHPPVWTIGREATDEIDLQGYRIRRGTQIYMSQYVTQRDARFFPDPERFLPERWSPENASSIPKFAYFPFAGGPRHCIGSNFAMMELCLCLVTVLRHYHIDLAPDHRIELQPSISLRPRHGIRATVSRR